MESQSNSCSKRTTGCCMIRNQPACSCLEALQREAFWEANTLLPTHVSVPTSADEKDIYFPGQLVPPGVYRRVSDGKIFVLNEPDYLPASLDGTVATYILLKEVPPTPYDDSGNLLCGCTHLGECEMREI